MSTFERVEDGKVHHERHRTPQQVRRTQVNGCKLLKVRCPNRSPSARVQEGNWRRDRSLASFALLYSHARTSVGGQFLLPRCPRRRDDLWVVRMRWQPFTQPGSTRHWPSVTQGPFVGLLKSSLSFGRTSRVADRCCRPAKAEGSCVASALRSEAARSGHSARRGRIDALNNPALANPKPFGATTLRFPVPGGPTAL